jgi:hypothetical protein
VGRLEKLLAVLDAQVLQVVDQAQAGGAAEASLERALGKTRGGDGGGEGIGIAEVLLQEGPAATHHPSPWGAAAPGAWREHRRPHGP